VSEYARTILRDLGVAIHIPGLMALVSIPVCLLADETFMVAPFAACAVVAIVPGQVMFRTFRNAGAMQVRHAMDMAILAWVTISLLGMIPLMAGAWAAPQEMSATLEAFRQPWNALFESVSGFTSTGLTMTAHPEDLPHALQWWRSFMQWIGGVGVIVLMLAVFHPSGDAHRLYLAEAREQQITASLVETVRTMWWLYLVLTVAALAALRLAGISWWHALNYAMTGIATGGFGVTDGNIGDFGLAPRLVMSAIVIVGAISFAVHYRLLVQRRLRAFSRDREVRLLMALLVIGGAAITLEAWWANGPQHGLDSAFHWVSALCTAGFQSSTFEAWSPTARLILIAGMVIGGMAGSTAGGLKLSRLRILGEGIARRIGHVATQPWRLTEHRNLGDDHEAVRHRRLLEAASLLALLWVTSLVAGTIVLLHAAGPNVSLEMALFEAASAMGNVGLSSGLAGPDLPWPGKAALIVMMWMGRLEIIPVLVLAASLRPRPVAHKARHDANRR